MTLLIKILNPRYQRNGTAFDAYLGDQLLTTHLNPCCAAARELKRMGYAPDTDVEFTGACSDTIALRGTVGWFAARRVVEGVNKSPTWAKYKENPWKGA